MQRVIKHKQHKINLQRVLIMLIIGILFSVNCLGGQRMNTYTT